MKRVMWDTSSSLYREGNKFILTYPLGELKWGKMEIDVPDGDSFVKDVEERAVKGTGLHTSYVEDVAKKHNAIVRHFVRWYAVGTEAPSEWKAV